MGQKSDAQIQADLALKVAQVRAERDKAEVRTVAGAAVACVALGCLAWLIVNGQRNNSEEALPETTE